MDRTTQIIVIFGLLLLGFTASAQKTPKQGVKAYPIYHLQGLGFDRDSSVTGLYGWIDPSDRAAVLQQDGSLVVRMDSLSDVSDKKPDLITKVDTTLMIQSIVKTDSIPVMKVETVSNLKKRPPINWDEELDFIPDWNGIDSSEFNGRNQGVVDSIDTAIIEEPLDSRMDSLDVKLLMDTIGVAVERVDSSAVDSKQLDTGIQALDVDSVAKVRSKPMTSDSVKTYILIKSDPSMLGNQDIDSPKLQTNSTRRPMLLTDKKKQEELPKEDLKPVPSEQNETRVIERIVERPPDYTGQYAGLTKSERERQLRLDAENARKIEQQRLDLEKQKLEIEQLTIAQSASNSVSSTETVENPSNSSTITPSDQKVSLSPKPQTIIVDRTSPSVIIQRDTMTEVAIEKIAMQIAERARKDSLEKLRFEAGRREDQQLIEGRFDRIESKMDTLLNALGKKTVMDRAVYNTSQAEMNVYFAINSHSIPDRQKMDLAQYLKQVSNMGKFKIVLSGYADNSGNMAYNQSLVEKRMDAVKQVILDLGIQPTEILLNNYGKQKANSSKTYNQLDRKVAIQIFSAEN